MAKTEATLKLEEDIQRATNKIGVFGCLEVTIGFGGKERVDYMTYDTKGVFRCYEIKVSKSDFHSSHANSFVGHYNYYVMTSDLYEKVKEEIPDWVGCYVGTTCIKRAKKQSLSNKVILIKSIGVPHEDVLKDSIIRSLYRDSQKLQLLESKYFVSDLKSENNTLKRNAEYYQNMYQELLRNVSTAFGRSISRILIERELTPEELHSLREDDVHELRD